MSNDEDTGKQRWERIVQEYAFKAYEAEEQFDTEGADGYVSNETHKRLATVAVSYHRALKEYRDEAVVDDGDLPDVSYLRERLGKKTRRKTSAPGRSSATTVTKAPAVTEIPVGQILETIDELHDFRHKLGMKGGVKGNTEHNDVSHDDLHELLTIRGQNEAAEAVPGGDDD